MRIVTPMMDTENIDKADGYDWALLGFAVVVLMVVVLGLTVF